MERARRPGRRGELLQRTFGWMTELRPGEAVPTLALLGSIFLLLATNYVLKPARDGLLTTAVVPGLADMELKAYSSFGQSLLLLGLIPLYARLSEKLQRAVLITRVTLFFMASFVVFWLLQPGLWIGPVSTLGIFFYLWVGVFNVFVVAQFWGFAADLYSDEAGHRLFPLIAVGAAAGATAGAGLTRELLSARLVGTYTLLLAAVVFLGAALVLMRFAEGRLPLRASRTAPEVPPDRSGALRLVLSHRLLLATALAVLLLNWIKTNGDNLLFGAIQEMLRQEVAALDGLDAAAVRQIVSDRTTAFYGDLLFWTSLVALFLQAFVASRVLRHAGFALLLLILPVVSLGSYALLTTLPLLRLFRVTKIVEDSLNYSLHNTALQVLWLPTTREMKYKAKSAVDTFFVRIGDGLAAATAFTGLHVLLLSVPAFFALNSALAVVWIALAVVIVRERRRLRRQGEP